VSADELIERYVPGGSYPDGLPANVLELLHAYRREYTALAAQLKAAQDRVQELIDSNARLIEQKAAEKERREAAEELGEAQDGLLVAYRLGSPRAADKVLDRLTRARAHFAEYQGSENDG
jgi:hypothetical protein